MTAVVELRMTAVGVVAAAERVVVVRAWGGWGMFSWVSRKTGRMAD
jgi:hypothetical protein